MKLNFTYITCFILTLFLIFQSYRVSAQNEPDSVFYLKGSVIDDESLQGLPNVHIINKTLKTATVSGYDGAFKLPAMVGDSITISMIGYKKREVVVQSEYANGLYKMVVRMNFSVINMTPIVVFGKTFAQFREDFKSLHLTPITMNQLAIDELNKELKELTGQYRRVTLSPIQYLYDQFNKSARLKRKLLKERAKWNDPEIFKDFPLDLHSIPKTEQD